MASGEVGRGGGGRPRGLLDPVGTVRLMNYKTETSMREPGSWLEKTGALFAVFCTAIIEPRGPRGPLGDGETCHSRD